jgi:hypothetical protein
MIKKRLTKYLEILKTEVLRFPNDKISTGDSQIKEIKQQISGKRRLVALWDI